MSQVLVKWVAPNELYDHNRKPEGSDGDVPVVPLSALREVVEGLKDGYTGDFAAYRWALNDLLASLGEQTAPATKGKSHE